MFGIVFFDTEIDPKTKQVLDIGAVRGDGVRLHTASLPTFSQFLQGHRYLCGHNIISHDLQYVHSSIAETVPNYIPIDTLAMSPLLFPMRPYHALVKDDKLQSDAVNNPLNDSIKAKELFDDEIGAFYRLPILLRKIFCSLLIKDKRFYGFFRFVNEMPLQKLENAIRQFFDGKICSNANISALIEDSPVELAYSLALINTDDRYSVVPAWVQRNYPQINNVMFLLRGARCEAGCPYCDKKLDVRVRLKEIFGFDSFRTYNGEPLQENAARAALEGKSLLAIFPTGGGKSITFQLPALIAGETERGLTVVISPLQSLMKDQVDNLSDRGIADAVTINGLLSPVERAEAIERVESGLASLLYISPESLRSASIERLLLSRNVVRFVIDEAHCFSTWGQDFRVDYLYIGDFIRNLQERKNQKNRIAVSCFTATAKQKVISDICEYFKQKLDIDLELYTTEASRTNLHYAVLYKESDDEKYFTLRDLIQQRACPTIVYVSRTKQTHALAKKLTQDGFPALPYNGKMERSEKVANQEAFLSDQVKIIVATSAFGMGVDKKDVGLVVHYDISASLEDYIQEAGRAGRDQSLQAECYVLFNDDDLDKHFILLNQTKLSMGEIQQVWKAIKDLTRTHSTVCRSALEIARQAGWDESTADIETRVRTAIAALENAGYVQRGRNMPRIYATSILVDTMEEASDRLEKSARFNEEQRKTAKRIMKSLISSRSIAKAGNDDAESRVDYLADRLGISREDIVASINLMREEGLLADSMDLSAFIRRTDSKNRSAAIVTRFAKLEEFLIDRILACPSDFSYKEVNDEAISSGLEKATIKDIKTIIYYWTIRRFIRKEVNAADEKPILLPVIDVTSMKRQFQQRLDLAYFIVNYLFKKAKETQTANEKVPVLFSLLKIQNAFNSRNEIRTDDFTATAEDVQNALLYLSKIGAMDLEGGFFVLYSGIQLERKILNNAIRYKNEDYRQLNEYYKLKIQQIHIVGEYAHMMVHSYDDALTFVNDYFFMEYRQFIAKYFKGDRLGQINRNITPGKYDKLFSELSEPQLKIVDATSKYIVAAAGPGSGKTRVLVHKLASLLLLEDIKHEQLLMLTFSRSAATEFKLRLISLIGSAAHYVEIKTFHSYCFDLLGKIGRLEDAGDIVQKAAHMIENGEVELGRITKSVLVIDEAQDMDEHEAALVQALMRRNEDMRVIAVGDDDQNIYEFRGSDSRHMREFIDVFGAARYELLDNYRSKQHIVALANEFVQTISQRMKSAPMIAKQKEPGLVSMTKHRSADLEVPIVEDILRTYHGGSACVLTATNEEALRVMGLLLRNNISARLIQTTNGFDLYNLAEIRYFLKALGDHTSIPTISDEVWGQAMDKLCASYQKSTCLPVCLKLLDTFAKVNKTWYYTDLIEFIHESDLDDFIENTKDTVLVSTMHKSKGREFDNVYLMLDRYDTSADAAKRALYVALTRAKNELRVHYYGNFMEGQPLPGVQYQQDIKLYPEPNEIILQLGHRDVVLNFFKGKKAKILSLRSGDALRCEASYLVSEDTARTKVLKFSKRSQEQLNTLAARGYHIQRAEIRFITAWKAEEDDEESAIILPTLYMVKRSSAK